MKANRIDQRLPDATERKRVFVRLPCLVEIFEKPFYNNNMRLVRRL